ncbi:anthocyanidin 3-O-glucosyltransferase [Zea mays]|nr:anthocyanidin 3-O-glucosyltransferase [Zea mays]ACG29356.1 anthocyanidin 3-O-glucosyltransferase [Zea mays]ACN28307.1 unknown [Zea mays]AQK83845.1 UDP-glycosyltransferase 72B1 [Zea mays]|eukprot:NP_001147999.1 anthocyanidin 3-O-glucosyltransferase [Zea mays]
MAPPPAMQSPGELNDGAYDAPHILFIPSAGIGHLTPVFRVIAGFSSRGIDVSVVTVLPTVSAAETDYFNGLFADYPAVRRVDMHLLPLDASEFTREDPFFLRWEALRRSVHLLRPIITNAAPRITAIITDITLTSCVIPIAKELDVPCHVLFPTAATMLSLNAYYPVYLEKLKGGPEPGVIGDAVDIPGVFRVPRSALPPALLDVNKLFTKQFIDNGRAIVKADGVLVNTFDAVEPAPLAALRGGKIVPGYPPVYTIGPLKSHATKAGDKPGDALLDEWLGKQRARSVVYVAFGNRSAARLDQIREIAAGLEDSGYPFLWVLKTTKVDREDDAELAEVLGDGYLERVKGRGIVTKGWVEQEELLKHPAVGMFVSHGGWNSALEASSAGVPLLVWPQLGDHRVNAMAAVRAGIGAWAEHWSWDGEDTLVTRQEIADKVKEVMADGKLRASVAVAREEAAKAVAEGGTSYRNMHDFIAKLKGGA